MVSGCWVKAPGIAAAPSVMAAIAKVGVFVGNANP
jgi:hypothetical protein